MLVFIMGKWSKESTVMLIEEVKKYPFIYDPSHKSYHDRRARKEALNDIATVISQVRPDTQGEDIKVRWNALRSAFQGCISKMRRQLNGTLSTDYTKVWYFDDMLFLCKVRPSRSGYIRTGNERAETEDSFVQNEDVQDAHNLVTVVEDSMDDYHEETQMCEIYTPESLPRKEVTTECFQKESLPGGIIQREKLERRSLERENLIQENLLNLQLENLQRGNLQRENLHRESLLRENHQRENLQIENPQRENVQRENFMRENLQRENLQGEAPSSNSLQGGNSVRENLRGNSFLGDDIQVDECEREDICIIDSLAYRDPPRDAVGSTRKRNHDTAFGDVLENAVKKLIDQPFEDADFTFGKLVAHELKSLRSPILKRKLKHKIMLDIIEVQNLQD